MDIYIRSGLHLSFFVLLANALTVWWVIVQLLDGAGIELLTDPITWAVAFLPALYWPMGVALTASTNSYGAIWHVPTGVRAILRAPLEYAAVVSVCGLVFMLSTLGIAVFTSSLGLAASVLAPAFGFPLAMSHGVMGSLLGHLAQARPDVFEE
jgi:hypothetical protein